MLTVQLTVEQALGGTDDVPRMRTTAAPEAITNKEQKTWRSLGFVHAGSVRACAGTKQLYKSVRSVVPTAVARPLERLENGVEPLITRAQNFGEEILQHADSHAYAAAHAAEAGFQAGIRRLAHHPALQPALAALEMYFGLVLRAAEQLKAAAWKQDGGGEKGATAPAEGIVAVVHAAVDAFKATVLKARQVTDDPDLAVHMVADAWRSLSSLPAVARLLKASEPATRQGVQAFTQLHDALVASPHYRQALGATGRALGYVQHTAACNLLLRCMSPLVGPAMAKAERSKALGGALEYWRPAGSADAADAAVRAQ